MATEETTTDELVKGVLATDLDGTLIPLNGCPQNKLDLKRLAEKIREREFLLVFVTGRHFRSVQDAIVEFKLPIPDWIICDVGTSIFQGGPTGKFEPVRQYSDCLEEILGDNDIQPLAKLLKDISGLRLQEDEKQCRFKLSYYVDAQQLSKSSLAITSVLDASGIAHELISSVDPFNGDGLIDILPLGVSKAFALNWWTSFRGIGSQSIIFAGDSGNDLAAMTAGYKTIVVSNADHRIAQQVAHHHKENASENLFYLAESKATSGVLAGLTFFGESNKKNNH